MAHILIGWELGGGRGHLANQLFYHDLLVAAGHRVSLAVQRLDGVLGEGRAPGATVWQAPVWPRLLGTVGIADRRTPATMGDILARLGIAQPDLLPALVGGWELILRADPPDLVIAEYAPGLLAAARGRVPTIATGSGFESPPPDLPRFPSLTGAPATHDEGETLDAVNRALARAGRPPLGTLAGLFACDEQLASVLPQFDPYAEWRRAPLAPPRLDGALPPLLEGGDEVFVYWPERSPPAAELWTGLARSRLPIRLYRPRLAEKDAAVLRKAGFQVEPHGLPFAQIAARSRLLVSCGGIGTSHAAALHGLPHLVVPFDVEKGFNAAAVARHGLGASIALADLKADTFAQQLRALHADSALHTRTRMAARQLRTRLDRPLAEVALETVGRLLAR